MEKILAFMMVISLLLVSVQADVLAAENSAEKMYEEGMEFFRQEDFDRAFARFQISGEVKKYAPAQNMLGVCYCDGLGTGRDPGEAEKYFRLAADQGYAPAQEYLAALEREKVAETVDYSSVSVGDTISFGIYEKDNDLTNGKEPIEWLVLDVQDNKALLISRYSLDCKPYHDTFTWRPFWESCTLRSWLNKDFMEAAFTAAQQKQIMTSFVHADSFLNSGIDPCNDTRDRVFLIGYDEANQYFSSEADRICKVTDYCLAQRQLAKKECGYTAGHKNDGIWWLRTLNTQTDLNHIGVTCVGVNGKIIESSIL